MCVRDDGDLRSQSLNGLGSLDSQHCDNIHELVRTIDLRIVRGWDCIPVTTGGMSDPPCGGIPVTTGELTHRQKR